MGVEVLAIPFGLSLVLWSLVALILHCAACLITRASSSRPTTASFTMRQQPRQQKRSRMSAL